MDGYNQWRSYLDLDPAEDELTYMFQRHREERAVTQQHFAESIPGYQPQQQNYTSPTGMAPNPYLLSQSSSLGLPSFWGSASSSFGAAAAARDDPTAVAGQPSSSSLSFSGGQASTYMLSGGSGCPEQEQDCVFDAMQQVQQTPEWRPWNSEAHVIAERRRRQKMQQQFEALATIVPDLTKVDKLSVLGSTIEYVKQLEEKVKALKEQSSRTTPSTSTSTFGNKCRRVIPAEKNDDLSDSADITTTSSAGGGSSNPAVEATVYSDTVLVKICRKDKRGVLVAVLSELEKRGLSILDTSVLPFADSCLSITIIAKVAEGFLNTCDLVNNLTMAIRGLFT